MTKHYVLIDYENVQPKNLILLNESKFQTLVFIGASQKTISTEKAIAMQSLGQAAEYIQISGNGKNAADFHLAYYIGVLSANDPKATFHIISKDTGFDPLVSHLRSRKIKLYRFRDIAEISALRLSGTATLDDKVKSIVKNLIGRGTSRPKKESTLSSTITSLMAVETNKKELQEILNQLECKGYIKITEDKVTYNLPKKISVVRAS